MHALLTTLRRGFKRWIGWKRLGIAASLLIGPLYLARQRRTGFRDESFGADTHEPDHRLRLFVSGA